jgi:3-hydroxymyristoyl/3-hydroxydecanoyl-(acyl carrier protein) dehydratase
MNNPYPRVVDANVDQHGAELTLHIDRGIACTEGHFPEVAVVPGIAQIDWAIRLAADYLAVEGDFSGMDVIKFQQLMLPGIDCQLMLKWLAQKQQLQFRFSHHDAVYSSGRISLVAR